MKSLVYENYSKFISATETIHKMKSNIHTMESLITTLDGGMKSLTTNATDVTIALLEKQSDVKRLHNVHEVLKRVRCNLPVTLTL